MTDHVTPEEARRGFAIIDAAVREHQPAHVFGLFSGGHDSLTATGLASEHPDFTAAVHIDTGIGIEETREFVRETCRDQGWPLIKLGPPEMLTERRMGPQMTYEEMVLEWGFPGPPQHKVMYTRLKERALRQLRREYPDALLVTGIRVEESVRRMRNYVDAYEDGKHYGRHHGFLWANPIWDWSKPDCHDYMEARSFTRNRVVDLIHKSGECLCGAFAAPDEIRELDAWFPDVARHIHDLERRVEEAGRIGCVWGRRMDEVHREQLRAFPILPLCTSCEGRRVTSPQSA